MKRKKTLLKLDVLLSLWIACAPFVKGMGEEKKDPPEEIPVTGMSISRASIVVRVNERKPLIASVYPENATEQRFFWELSDSTVTAWYDRTIYGIKPGNAVLTVWSFNGKFRASCGITVIPREEETNNINR